MKRFASLLLLSATAVASPVETKIFVPAFNSHVKVFTNSITSANSNTFKAVLSKDISLTSLTTHIEASAGTEISYYPNGNLKGTKLTLGSIQSATASINGFTRVEFYENGSTKSIADDYYSTVTGHFETSRGNFVCSFLEGRDIRFFDNGDLMKCTMATPATVTMNDGALITASAIEFTSPNVIKAISLRNGSLEASCETGTGKSYNLPGSYTLNADEKIISANTVANYRVQFNQYIKDTFQFKVRECELKGWMSTQLADTTRVQGFRVMTSVAPTLDNSVQNAIKICQKLGFESWSGGAVFKASYLLKNEQLFDLETNSFVMKNAGEKVNSFEAAGCSMYGNLI